MKKILMSVEKNHSIKKSLELLEKDIWRAEDLGLNPNTTHSIYHLNFSRIKLDWLKLTVKRFIRLQSATKSLGSCCAYLVGLALFSDFLITQFKNPAPEIVNRHVITQYIEFLKNRTLSAGYRKTTLIHLRTFHYMVMREKWLPWPTEPLIYPNDIPTDFIVTPRFIPEIVITQLQQHKHQLPDYMQHLITILLETGRRISEVCPLTFDCLEQDEEKDYFLRVTDKKLKKIYLIPISSACVQAIQSQQSKVPQVEGKNKHYLFPSRQLGRTPHVSARYVNRALNRLAQRYQIKDSYGKIWHFHTHQFRHTVGTRMINNGVPQTIVQRYLGHESPQMTARYAHIHNETLKAAFNQYQGKLVDIHGKLRQFNSKHKDAQWLQYNIMAQALPNGICALPLPQQRCPHANACLTCVHFRTHEKFLPQHRAQLEETNKIIDVAKTNGWQRQLEMNLAVKKSLESIIASLPVGCS